MVTPKEYAFLKTHGLTSKEVDRQITLLKNGVKYSRLNRPAVLNDGIELLSLKKIQQYATAYEKGQSNISILKFVPASGAATRMFKELATYIATKEETSSIQQLFSKFNLLAFSAMVPSSLSKLEKADYLLNTLNYQSIPKGLIPFHQYQNFTRTPFKEHWIEGLQYAVSNGKVNLHFTVSAAHQKTFENIYKTRITAFAKEYNQQLSISFSQQKKSTDTLIIDTKGNILTDEHNKPIIRPGGHGALIQNLNSVSADLVFIKNIDNVVHQNHLETTIRYKKALAGRLLALKDLIFEQLKSIEKKTADITNLESVGAKAQILCPALYQNWNAESKIIFWKAKLNRPIRVCGMVKNQGEPGGGPFWVQNHKEVSLQIVETAQIDISNKQQAKILNQSTHFNPVDLVCYLTDYNGNKFDLTTYINNSTAFITPKSVGGQDVNVLEHPGLWNGAMANWITLFVEVPIETFNPVKTVNDLLKPAHLS